MAKFLRYNEVPLVYIEVIFLYFTIAGVKTIVHYTADFVI